ncbi:hypothetical protein N7510_010925 [Penicillium lagena]|uniref:uncharacterized protein n=1 Tax=Penicillium lagena TaxID=94218 RepID=UPI0025418AB4|nr:uncharacterized protein N7510_010925 [Penicillium lagena]KAJ5601391.1 hypothetical protein N7510_010925 [Penicillium lagena]
MSSQFLTKIAVVGAGGQLGKPTLQHLLAAKRFNITLITRDGSDTKFPSDPSITVKPVDYNSQESLVSAFKGNEALVLILNFAALEQTQMDLIKAASAAGIKYILPTEYGSDNAVEKLSNMVPINALKAGPRNLVEELAKTHPGLTWIGLVSNPWFDYSLNNGGFGINVKTRTATLYDGGVSKFNTTLIPTVGLAIARLLSLPVSTLSSPKVANKFIYVSSFHTTQREILSAVQKATGTNDADWNIDTSKTSQGFIDEGNQLLKDGNFSGMVNLLYGTLFNPGLGGDYESTKGTDNKLLGLPQQDERDMAVVVQEIIENS